MLTELHITDFAIIDDLSLTFEDGLTIITGETGAGKSILVDAVNLVLGGPADRDFVRSGTDQTSVEAVFRVPTTVREEIKALLDEEQIEYDALEQLVMSRQIRVNGRNTARINDSPCKLTTYREIGSLLIDIHGQSEHLSLLKPKEHIYLLDRFAGVEEERRVLEKIVRQLHDIQRQIRNLHQDEAAIARRVDILKYQISEIETAKLRLGEDDELETESKFLANSEKLRRYAHEAEVLLFSGEAGESAAVELLEQASILLSKLAELDPNMQPTAELAESISIQVGELAEDVRHYGDKIDVTPGHLDLIEERLQAINALKRKYGGSIEAVLKFADKATEELNGITNSEERLQELAKEQEKLLKDIGKRAIELSKRRQKAGKEIGKMIELELKDLRMPAARFEVHITQQEDATGCYVGEQRFAFDLTGIDEVEFMLATNFGEPLKPLAKVASGGETARSMLALKSVLSRADQTPSLIFDEIDQGIGGRLGGVVGEKLWRLSRHHQVFCVTHLAQLASFADNHYRVSKGVIKGRTITHVEPLAPEGKIEELMMMLGSETESGRQNADDLIIHAQQIKTGETLKM